MHEFSMKLAKIKLKIEIFFIHLIKTMIHRYENQVKKINEIPMP